MKKTFKLLALALVLVLLVGLFAACGNRLSGVYSSTDGTTYEFSGTNFTVTAAGMVMKGTYEIVKIDEDYRIFLTVKEQGTAGGKITALTEDKYYVLGDENGGNDGVEYLERETDDGTRYIKIDSAFYYEVKN